MSFKSDSSDTEEDITESGKNKTFDSTLYKQKPPGVNNDQSVKNDIKMGVASNPDDKYYCHNEDHETALSMASAAEKRYHIIRAHKCIAHGCFFSAELNKDLANHYEQVHTRNAKFTCNLCGVCDDDKISHYESYHFKCNSCQQWFKEHLDLKTHETQCQNAVPNEDKKESDALQFVSASKENHSLYLDKSPVAIQVGETLCKMISKCSLSQEEKNEGIRHIKAYQAQNMIARARTRRGENARLCSDLLFSIPTFYKPGESYSNTKSLSTILKDVKVFDCEVESSESKSWQNYEELADIFSSISTATTMCKLSESVAVAILDTLLSQQVKNSVIAYKQCELTDLSYSGAVTALQFLFVPLNLEKIERICMGSSKSQTQSMFDYAAKIHKALDLCSQRLDSEDRKAYIENHMRRQIFNNLPPKIKNEVEKKQNIFSPFSSTELLDFCLAERPSPSTYETQYKSLYNVRESESDQESIIEDISESSSDTSNSEDDQFESEPVSVIRQGEFKYLKQCDEVHLKDRIESAPQMQANLCVHYDSDSE